ncbi:MAG: hypothetical protein ACOCZ5_00500 [bacterium]
MNFCNAIYGMRNPLKSWNKSDSYYKENNDFILGDNDRDLAMRLVKAGSDHRKFMRQIFVSMDVSAPWYWWRQYHTYKVGTTENSTSQMHLITNRRLTLDDFAWDWLSDYREYTLKHLNTLIMMYHELNLKTKRSRGNKEEIKELKKQRKAVWRELIQDIPASFIYLKTCTLNYENLRNIYHSRKNHKLHEWKEFCSWIETLPYSELITVKQ